MRPRLLRLADGRFWRRFLLIAPLFAVLCAGCQGSGERWFRWPWKKDRPAGMNALGPPQANPDPFLPPPRGQADPDDDFSFRDSSMKQGGAPVVRLQRPKLSNISLVSADGEE